MAFRCRRDLRAELGVAELQRRQVDGEHQIRAATCQRARLGTASSSISWPSWPMSPSSSASGMNSSGEIMPNSGWGQRQSSSARCSRLLWVQMMGW